MVFLFLILSMMAQGDSFFYAVTMTLIGSFYGICILKKGNKLQFQPIINNQLSQQKQMDQETQINQSLKTNENSQILTRKKIMVYLSTLLLYLGFVMIFGVTARIKIPIEKQFELDSAFLGFIDYASFIGRLLGTIYIFIYPPKQARKQLFIHCLSTILFTSLLTISSLFPEYSRIIIIVCMFLGGFSRAYILIIASFVMNICGQTRIQVFWVNFWFSVGYVGDVIGVLLINALLNAQVTWNLALLISMGLLMIFSIIMALTVDQISLKSQQQQIEGIQTSSLRYVVKFAQNYLKKMTNFLHSLETLLMGIYYYSMFMWLPYYFEKIGFVQQASFLSILYPIFFMIGSPIFFLLCQLIFKVRNLAIITSTVLILNLIPCFWITQLRDDPQTILFYIFSMILNALLLSGPETRLFMQQPKQRSSSIHQMTMIWFLNRLNQQIFGGLAFIIIGYTVKINVYSLFYILFIVTACFTIVHILRAIFYPQDFQFKKQNE